MSAALDHSGKLLMPKATAIWLIDNTALTFSQIAEFTEMTEIEINALADGEIGYGLVGRNPIDHGELTKDELDRCQNDPSASLKLAKKDLPAAKTRAKGPRYTPISKRGDKPDAIAYVLKNAPDISDAQICKLIGTTKPTIESIRNRTHANHANIKPRHPADLGLCTYTEFERVYEKALKAAGKDPEALKAKRNEEIQKQLDESDAAEGSEGGSSSSGGGFDFSNFLGNSGNN